LKQRAARRRKKTHRQERNIFGMRGGAGGEERDGGLEHCGAKERIVEANLRFGVPTSHTHTHTIF
jgi:hypothetical protein